MWRSSEQSHWVESLKLQPVPLPELQDTVRSAGPRKSAALLLGPQCVSGAGESLGSLGTFLLAFPIASDLDEPSRQGPASLQEQLAGQAFSALTEAVGPSGSPVHSGEKEATSVSVRVGQGWLKGNEYGWRTKGGFSVTGGCQGWWSLHSSVKVGLRVRDSQVIAEDVRP